MTIFVGSKNPVKINAVTIAASEQWPGIVVKGIDVKSEVSEQPWGDEETKLGSENRARNVLEQGLLSFNKIIDSSGQVTKAGIKNNFLNLPAEKQEDILGVGLEGGVMKFDNKNALTGDIFQELWSTVWVTVVDTSGNIMSSNGARFKIPDVIAKPIIEGQEMGPVVGGLFAGANIKQEKGAIGVITRDFVDRTEEYTGIAKLALGLWYGKDWEEDIIKK